MDGIAQLESDAAAALRRLAANEDVKAAIAGTPQLFEVLGKAARRYVAGETSSDALTRVRAANARGHAATVDFMGESARDPATVEAATSEFERLALELRRADVRCSVSFDLSHLGSVLDRALGGTCARRLALATMGRAAGTAAEKGCELMISAEGHDRTQQTLDEHELLCREFDHVGVTVQARLHRTTADVERLLERPGRIRLVKGAFDFPSDLGLSRDDPLLASRFDALATRLLESGHPCSIATHDPELIAAAEAAIRPGSDYTFEMLDGIGREALDALHARGHPTQEYVVYGNEWFLYVCNRIAEHPPRLYQALIDVLT